MTVWQEKQSPSLRDLQEMGAVSNGVNTKVDKIQLPGNGQVGVKKSVVVWEGDKPEPVTYHYPA